MTLIACAECGNEVSTKASACPKCGAKVPHFKWWLWLPLGAICLFLFGGVLIMIFGDKNRMEDRTKISMCWEQQEDKASEPGMQRFMAAVCQQMERSYEKKYGYKP